MPNQQKILLKNAQIVTNEMQSPLIHGHLEILDNKIATIIPSSENDESLRSSAKYKKVFDLKSKVVIPGFVQVHTHLCQVLFRNLADDLELLDWLSQKIWPMEARHNAESLYVSAQLGIAELLAGGTTTILDMGTIQHTDSLFRAAENMGIRAYIGKCMMDASHPDWALQESMDFSLKESLRLAEAWHGKANDRLRYAFAPRFVLACSEMLLRIVQKYAREQQMLVHTHASENRNEVENVRRQFRCDNIEYLHKIGLMSENLVLAHCIWLSETEEKILRDTGTRIAHCPSSNLKLASGIAHIPELREQGILVGLGADGPPCNNNLNMFQEMRLASLLQKPRLGPAALPAAEVFRMATIDGACILGLEKETGSIAPGKKADLVVLDLDQPHSFTARKSKSLTEILSAIVYSAGPQNVLQTWVDGALVYDNGIFCNTQPMRHLVEATAAFSSLIADI